MKKVLTVVALALAALTATIAAVPGTASAAVRTGSVQDPQGDASGLSGPVLDITLGAVHYDDVAGTVRVTWTYAGDITDLSAGGGQIGGGLWLHGPMESSTPSAWVGWFSHIPDPSGGPGYIGSTLSLSHTAGILSAPATVSADGRTVTVEFTHPQLVGRNWQRGDGSVQNGDTVSKFWFDGFIDPGTGAAPIDPGSGSGGGGGDEGSAGMTINDGDLFTNDPRVNLSVVAPSWATSLRVANDGGFGAAKVFPAEHKITWRLAESGKERLPKTVYLRFGSSTQTFTDEIILDQTKPTVSSATIGSGGATTSAAVTATASKRRTYRVRIRAKDATSGVAKVQFAARSKRHPSALRKFTRISRYKAAHAPRYVRVRDRAGNYSRWRSIR